MPFAERARLMTRAAEILEAGQDQFGRLMTSEMGKPLQAARQEAAKCASACRYYAAHAERLLADEPVEAGAGLSYIRYQRSGRCWPSCPGTSLSGRSSVSRRRP